MKTVTLKQNVSYLSIHSLKNKRKMWKTKHTYFSRSHAHNCHRLKLNPNYSIAIFHVLKVDILLHKMRGEFSGNWNNIAP